jgi:hypothetical protein
MNNQSDCFTGISQHEKRDVAMELAYGYGTCISEWEECFNTYSCLDILPTYPQCGITHNIGKIKY